MDDLYASGLELDHSIQLLQFVLSCHTCHLSRRGHTGLRVGSCGRVNTKATSFLNICTRWEHTVARERAEPLWLCRFAVCLSVVVSASQTSQT